MPGTPLPTGSTGDTGTPVTVTGGSYWYPCFTGDVRVPTPSGVVPIRELAVGDRVLGSAGTGVRPVSVARVHRGVASQLVTLRTPSVHLTGATPRHPFFVAELAAWVAAEELVPGLTVLVLDDGRLVREPLLEVDLRALEAPVPVLNLSLEGDGGYLAGGLLGLQKHDATRPWLGARLGPVARVGAAAVVLGGCLVEKGTFDTATHTGLEETDADTDSDTDADTDSDTDADADTSETGGSGCWTGGSGTWCC